MEQLKTYKMVDEKYCTDCVCVIPSEVYLKSEADKVIANREYEIAQLKESIGKLLKSKTEQIMDEVIQKTLVYGEGFVPAEHAMLLVSELRHHKYKRCLAMARWCASRSASWCLDPADEQLHKSDFYDKWKNRWLELAEKFKEAK